MLLALLRYDVCALGGVKDFLGVSAFSFAKALSPVAPGSTRMLDAVQPLRRVSSMRFHFASSRNAGSTM